MQVMKMMTSRGGVANNQYVVDNGATLDFQSYSSHCASFNKKNKELTLFADWDYSKTTMKYLLQFLREFVGMVVSGVPELRKKVVIDGVQIQFDGQEMGKKAA